MTGPEPQQLGGEVPFPLSSMNWAQRLGVELTPYAWATHILIGVAIQALVAAILGLVRVRQRWALGAAVSIGYAWSREKTEFEFSLRSAAHLRTLGPFWYRGFLPFEWQPSSQLEFAAPTVAVILVVWLVERCQRRNR